MIETKDALEQLAALQSASIAAKQAKANKVERPYLGVHPQQIDALCKEWRAASDLDGRIDLAKGLWGSNVFDARIAAAKLLTQARIADDQRVWQTILAWVGDCDCAAITDQVCTAGQKRLNADLTRLDQLEPWVTDEVKWVRRAALMMTLPWSKLNHPKPTDLVARTRILEWAASLVPDHDVDVQKAIAGWLRVLSKHDPSAVVEFLEEHSKAMNPKAVAEAKIHLS